MKLILISTKNMKKFLIVIISILATLFAIALIISGYFWLQNKEASKKANVGENREVFESRINNYKVSYPENLSILWGENESKLPEKLRLADFEKDDNKPNNNAVFDITVTQDQNCKIINECAAVKDLEKEKYTSQAITLNGVSAIKLTNLENMGKPVIVTFVLWNGKIYAISFTPSNITSYENSKATYENLVSNFQFLENSKTSFFAVEKTFAATNCDNIDQQYAPGTTLTREPLRTTNDTGQTFRPAQNSICKIGVELESVDSGQTATIWLYSGGGTLLAQKTQAVSSGWNYFTLDSAVSVTPETEYVIKININGGAGYGRNQWLAGEQGTSNGYSRGHAIIAGYDEQDLDFHFKEYYTTTTDDGGGDDDGDEPTAEPTITASTESKTKTTAGTAPAAKDTKDTKDTTLPKPPFNLHILHLRLTGLNENYVDLEWDKVSDENLAGYLIYYGIKSGTYYYVIDNGTANNIRIDHLLPGQDYFFVAHTYDKAGNISNPSNEVKASLLHKVITNYWWVLVILGGILLVSIIYLIVLKKKEVKQIN